MNEENLSVLQKLLESNGLQTEQILENLFLHKIREHWKELVGPIYHTNSFPNKLSHGKLWIAVTHSAYQMELSMHEWQILGDIQSLLQTKSIKRFQYIVKPFYRSIEPAKPVFEGSLQGKEGLVAMIHSEKDNNVKNKLLDLIRVL
ncbi:MAG: DUF721 domain-containing protein [Spirochaetota bacterium]